MKIYKQISHFDCGICITQSLIEHFYQTSINRETLINATNLNNDGLSLLDLEKLNADFGVELESYEVSFDELIKYDTRDFLVLVLKLEHGMHYVIAKKFANYFMIYDSWRGKYMLSYDELSAVFANILITCKRAKQQVQQLPIALSALETWKFELDWIYYVQLFFLNLLLLGLNLLSSYFLKSIFNFVINTNDLGNLGVIIFIATFGYVGLGLNSYLIKKLEDYTYIKYQKRLTLDLISALERKNNNFFQKISNDQFVILDWHKNNIAKHYSNYLPNLFINFFSLFALVIFVLAIDWRVLLLITIAIIIQCLYNYANYWYNKSNFGKLKYLHDQNKRCYFNLEMFLKNEVYHFKLQRLLTGLKDNVWYQGLLDDKIKTGNNAINKLNNFLNHAINLSLYSLGAYLLVVFKIPFGSIILISTLYVFLNGYVGKLIQFVFFQIDYQMSKKIFNNIVQVETCQDVGVPWKLPNHIKLQDIDFYYDDKAIFHKLNLVFEPNTLLVGPSGSGKSTIYKMLLNQIKPHNGQIWYDLTNMQSINQLDYSKNVIYQKNLSILTYQYPWKEILNHLNSQQQAKLYQIAKLLQLEMVDNLSPDTLSSGQIQFLNLVQLICEKNKLIILDECTSHMDQHIRQLVYQHIIAHISQKNFLICSEHNFEFTHVFKKVINLKSYAQNSSH